MPLAILNKDLGAYYPSFFRMVLDFEYKESPLEILRLDPKFQGAFVHEYIHFIQDISTHFGLNNTYVYAEYFHSSITSLYKLKKKQIKLPVKLYKNRDNVELNKKISDLCTGDYMTVDSTIISDIITNKNIVETPFGILDVHTYTLVSGRNRIRFGGRAIMESMAFLIEQILVPKSGGAKDYPYHSANIVSNYIYPHFEDDRLRLIALCDVSLMMSNPAKVFITYLQYYKENGIFPTPEDIYNRFYSEPHSFMGQECDTIDGMLRFHMMMADYISKYISEELDPNFKKSVMRLILTALNKRITSPYYILDICRDGELMYNTNFSRLFSVFGSPLIQDIKRNYSMIPPTGDKTLSQFSIMYMYAIEQIYNTLYNGADCCEMLDCCENSKAITENAPIVDERCVNNPWLRCKDMQLCPYGVLWKHWSLSDYKIKK